MATKEGIVLTIFYTWGRRKRRQKELGIRCWIVASSYFQWKLWSKPSRKEIQFWKFSNIHVTGSVTYTIP